MIPKIIHYCWFGKKEIPDNLKKCMKSWSVLMPDFKIMRWDESNFDVKSTKWTEQAYEAGKYAFVSDYVRLKVLEEYGGIYLDTDVMLLKSLEALTEYKAFSGFENEFYITSAVIGCEQHFNLIKEFLEFYEGKEFFNESGKINNDANVIMMTDICKKYGLKTDDSEQEMAEMHIFPREYFCPIDFYHNKNITENSMAIHYFDASWLDDDTKRMIEKERKPLHKAYISLKQAILNLIEK